MSTMFESPITIGALDVWASAKRGTGQIIGLIGRCTNPDAASRWLLHRLERAPDVAEIL